MDGIDPGLATLLKENGFNGGRDQWSNPLFWLIILGFLRDNGGGGIFGGGAKDAGGAAIGSMQAKLDCLQKGQQDAALAAFESNMTNQHHTAGITHQNATSQLAASLAECCCNLRAGQERIINEMLRCCCDLKAGQKDIITEICKQTQLIVTNATANTQRIVDNMNRIADDEKTQKLNDCKVALSNAEQTKQLIMALGNNNHQHGGGGKA